MFSTDKMGLDPFPVPIFPFSHLIRWKRWSWSLQEEKCCLGHWSPGSFNGVWFSEGQGWSVRDDVSLYHPPQKKMSLGSLCEVFCLSSSFSKFSGCNIAESLDVISVAGYFLREILWNQGETNNFVLPTFGNWHGERGESEASNVWSGTFLVWRWSCGSLASTGMIGPRVLWRDPLKCSSFCTSCCVPTTRCLAPDNLNEEHNSSDLMRRWRDVCHRMTQEESQHMFRVLFLFTEMVQHTCSKRIDMALMLFGLAV